MVEAALTDQRQCSAWHATFDHFFVSQGHEYLNFQSFFVGRRRLPALRSGRKLIPSAQLRTATMLQLTGRPNLTVLALCLAFISSDLCAQKESKKASGCITFRQSESGQLLARNICSYRVNTTFCIQNPPRDSLNRGSCGEYGSLLLNSYESQAAYPFPFTVALSNGSGVFFHVFLPTGILVRAALNVPE